MAKFYGSYRLPFGTQVGGFFYAGSGTPMSTVVNTTNTIPVLVNGRGDMGRTPLLTPDRPARLARTRARRRTRGCGSS